MSKLGLLAPSSVVHAEARLEIPSVVSMSAIDFHVTVALDYGSAAADPIRELLQAFDTLLPQVRQWAEPVLPVLSNLASISEAPFTLKAFEQRDIFASLGGLGLKAGSFYAQDWTRQLMLFLGSSDMIGNPLGFWHRVTDARNEMIKSVERSVEDRDALLLGRGVWDGVAGTSSSRHGWRGCSTAPPLPLHVWLRERPQALQLVAVERPRGIVDGAVGGGKVLLFTVTNVRDLVTNPSARRLAGGRRALGAASIILKGVDKGVDMRTRARHARGAPRAAGAAARRRAAPDAAVRVDGRPRAALLRDSFGLVRPRPRPPVVRRCASCRRAALRGGATSASRRRDARSGSAGRARAAWRRLALVSLTPDALSDLVERRLFRRRVGAWDAHARGARVHAARADPPDRRSAAWAARRDDRCGMAAGKIRAARDPAASRIGTRRSRRQVGAHSSRAPLEQPVAAAPTSRSSRE